MPRYNRSRTPYAVRRGGQRRDSLWVIVDSAATTMTASGGTLIYTSNAALAAYRPYTIVRSRVFAHLKSDQAAVTENQWAAFGLCVVSQQASDIGVTAVPTPLTDLSSDLWFLHQIMGRAFVFNTSGATEQGSRYEIDSRVMRKVEEGQDLIGVGEVSTVLGDGVVLRTAGRILIKPH